jgi:hypothetical protein
MNVLRTLTCLVVSSSLTLAACGGGIEDSAEIAQVAGEAMASFDEASTGGGGFAMRTPARLQAPAYERVWNELLPEAHAAACYTRLVNPFSACTNGVRTRTFDSCTVGIYTLTGSVTLTFSDTACAMAATNNSVTRTASFNLSNSRGSLAVSSEGGGQRITRTGATAFAYNVLGMKRVLSDKAGKALATVTSKTTSDIGVTGTSRADRTLNGGTLELTNETRGYTVSLSPTDVKWTAGCLCPVSGKLTGSVTGKQQAKTFTVEFTECGKATITTESKSKEEVTLERCGAI